MPIITHQRVTHCPWGQIQHQRDVAEGITIVTTASHGGYVLSKERFEAMPSRYKLNTYGKGRCFEEDCEWALVVLAFPDEFPESDRIAAQQTANSVYPSLKA